MNNNFYAIEIASAAYDQRYLKHFEESNLADAARRGRPALLAQIARLIACIL